MAESQRLSLAPAGDHTALLPAPATGLFCCPRPLLREDARGGLIAVGVGVREEETGWLMNDSAAVAAAAVDGRPYFTASQLEELQVQVLVFKHMLVGAPVPPELLLSVRRSFESMAARLYPHGAYGYCSYFGKKFDPEPGRCRRTDGKKWRCSKDAHPESKYCERHMHRGRNRSRKPVESPAAAAAPLQSPAASTLISLAPSGSSGSESRRIGPSSHVPFSGTVSQLQSGAASFEGSSKGFRYPYGDKAEAGERGFFSEGSASARGIETDHQLDNNSWGLMSSFPLSKASNVLSFESSYPQFPSLNDLGHLTYSSMAKQNQAQHSFLGSEFGLADPVKQSQELRPFFNEWPKTRGSWSDLEDERSNPSSFSTTQLSIAIPKTSSDFSATSSSRSPPIGVPQSLSILILILSLAFLIHAFWPCADD